MINIHVTRDHERREEFRERDSRLPGFAIQEDAHQREDLTDKTVQSAQYEATVAIEIPGNREWSEDLQFAESLHPDIWDRCVIVQANDTTDLGTARLYLGNNPPQLVDEYHEERYTDECMQGEKAAAMMFAEHNIPCLSTFSNPYRHRN
jgi:hypothetical protein